MARRPSVTSVLTTIPVISKRRITGYPMIPRTGIGGEVCVNFIDPPRSKRRTSGTHDVASDFAERPLVKPVSTSLRGDILRCRYIYRGERARCISAKTL